MPRKRQLVLTRSARAAGVEPGTMLPMGTRAEVFAALARFNTSPDGSPSKSGTDFLYGPGMFLELQPGSPKDELTQAMVTLTDEEIGLPVLMRLCKSLGYAMTDLETGRTFG